MYFMSDPQALHVTRNVIPVKLGVDLHLHRVHIPLVLSCYPRDGVEYGYDANIILTLRKYARICVSEPVSRKRLYLAVTEFGRNL